MNHFDAQSHVHMQNKIENSVHRSFTVLKAYKHGWTSWIDNKNYSATEVKTNEVSYRFPRLFVSLFQNNKEV